MKRALVVGPAFGLALAIACQVPAEHFRVRDANGGSASDAGADALDADLGPCDVAAPWGPPTLIGGLGPLRSVARLSPDELTAYFGTGSDGTFATNPDTLFVATRSAIGSSFGSATVLTGVNGSDGMGNPSISADGSMLFYAWGQQHAQIMRDIYLAMRIGSASQFGSGMKMNLDLDSVEDEYPFVATDGTLWFVTERSTDTVPSIYRAPYVGSGQFGGVVEANNLNSTSMPNTYPLLSADLLHAYFQRGGAIFAASRGSAGASFGGTAGIDEINLNYCMGTVCRPAWISPDNCRLYIGRGASGSAITMYVLSKPPNP